MVSSEDPIWKYSELGLTGTSTGAKTPCVKSLKLLYTIRLSSQRYGHVTREGGIPPITSPLGCHGLSTELSVGE